MRLTILWGVILGGASFFMAGSVWADEIFSLSFDNVERTPVSSVIYLDGPKTEISKIRKSDSIRLARGIKGLGVYLNSRYEHIVLPEEASVAADKGAIALWVKILANPDEKNRVVLAVDFPQGRFLLLDETAFAVQDRNGKWDYGHPAPEASQWERGQWHHVVLNWSSESGIRQVFVDGIRGPLWEYSAPAGRGQIFLSSPPTDASEALPVCGVLDEVSAYDEPLTDEAVQSLYDKGRESLGEASEEMNLEVSVYPNLAKTASVTLNPPPNYFNNDMTCNDENDEIQLADDDWQFAWFATKKSVGWNRVSGVVLEYDLGTLKQIGAVGINIGAGDSGIMFPSRVTFYVGSTEDTLTQVGEVDTSRPYPDPEDSRWHSQLVGVSNVNRIGRYVRIETEGVSLFADEIFITAKDAHPEFKSLPSQNTTTNK